MNNKLSLTITLTVILTVMIIAAAPVLAATLSRDMPTRVDPAADFTATLNLPDAVAGEELTLEETLPAGVSIKTWEITGTKESKTALLGDSKKYRVKDNAYGWSVTPTGPVILTYTATAPTTEGNLDFNAVWFDKSGFNKNSFTLSVATVAAPTPTVEPAAPTPAPTPASTPATPAAKQTATKPAQSTTGAGTWVLIAGLIIIIGVVIWYYYSRRK